MIIQANSLQPFPLASGSVQVCVTSPPYWGLRSYLDDDDPLKDCELGREQTPAEFTDHMVQVFREVWRVLADDGVAFLNLGDSYMTDAPGGKTLDPKYKLGRTRDGSRPNRHAQPGLKHKDLVGIPWMVAFALRDDGWYLRSEITWAKKAPMPEPVFDRPATATEKIFLFAKQANYFFDAEAAKEKSSGVSGGGFSKVYAHAQPAHGAMALDRPADNGTRNMRNWWLLGPEPFPLAHFATFPTEVPRRCILAGSRPGDVVLDPFAGSGTTGAVARLHGRRFVGMDLNGKYLRELALPRAEGKQTAAALATLPLFATPALVPGAAAGGGR